MIEDNPEAGPVEHVGIHSTAPAQGEHEPSPLVGGDSWYDHYSQTAAASDPGRVTIEFSNGQEVVPSPDHISGLPLEWASAKMANSQPGFTFRPTLFARIRKPHLIYRPGSSRIADPGPPSQGPQYPPAPGLPLGERRPSIVPPSSAGPFKGDTVTAKLARKFMGPRGPKTKRVRPKFSPPIRHR